MRKFSEAYDVQGQSTVAPHAPPIAHPNSSLSRRYGPTIISWDVGAESGLFQPILTLAQKGPELTPSRAARGQGRSTQPRALQVPTLQSPYATWLAQNFQVSPLHGVPRWGQDATIW